MQPEENCMWYLIKLRNDTFALQYSGPDPDKVFPADLSG
jgi:hypothetical protein